MPRLSILIPWRGPTAQFEDTLVSVLANRPENAEVIVVHRGEYADPYELRREVLLVEHDEDASLGALLHRGLEVAGGELLHVISCGVRARDGWCDGVWRHFEDPDVASVTPLVVRQDDPRRIVSAGVALGVGGGRRELGRGRRVGSPPHSAWGPSLLAGFYRPEALRAVGGFAEATGELVDADVAASLRQAGWQHRLDCDCRLEVGADWPSDEATVEGAARHAERLYWRQARLLGWRGLAAHGLHVGARLLAALPRGVAGEEFRGRVGALGEWSAVAEHRRRMAAAAESRQQPATIHLDRRRESDSRGRDSRGRRAA